MKVLTLSHYFEDHRGGVEIVAGRLARELTREGCEVTWLATGTARSDKGASPVKRVALPATNIIECRLALPYPLLAPQALALIAAAVRDADVVLAHDAIYLTSVAGFLFARRLGKPFVVVQHIGLVPYRNPLLRAAMAIANRLIVQPILKRAEAVVFISEITRRELASLAFKRAPLLIFNGVDASIFVPPKDEGQIREDRTALGLPSDGPIVLFVGRFVEKKGLPILERLARTHAEILFVFAGWGALDPAQWDLPNTRVFSALSGASLAPLYRAADLLLLPSVGEGFPLVVQEALACGLPALCGAETATADAEAAPFLEGVAIGPNLDETAEAFGAALTAALAKGCDVETRARRADFAARRYSWSAAAQHYGDLLRDLLERSRHPASPARQGQAV